MSGEDSLDPADAFSLVGHDVRFHILLALSRADDPLAFSELRERVGVEDPGQFNYHLGKLTDRFARKTDAGYATTTAGDRVVGAMLSGGLTDTLDRDPIDLDTDCPKCGTALEMRFPASAASVRCDDCGYNVVTTTVPAGVLDGVPDERAPRVVSDWFGRTFAALREGFCLYCDNRLAVSVRAADHPDAPEFVDGDEYPAGVVYECGRCETKWPTSVPGTLVRHTPVVAFYHDHGVDVQTAPLWERDVPATTAVTVAQRDPLRVDVTFAVGGDDLHVTVDDELAVVDTERA
jgi:DNA-directed RNA polymerase subunit RPC12/RpoP